VFSRNQVGPKLYIHENRKAAAEAIRRLATKTGFEVEVSDDARLFSDEGLKRFAVIVFNNTNNEVFETEREEGLQRFVRRGGGVVGIHSATGAMRQWPWFWSMMGGKFVRHPKLQPFKIKVKDPKDISTAHLPPVFEWTDEFYYVDHIAEGLHVLLAGDLTSVDDPDRDKYPGTRFGDEFPLAWRQEFEGGRVWYTALGHKPEHYSDPKLARHIEGGILWAMGRDQRQ
jgi:type 1 glutamine amidotransferase